MRVGDAEVPAVILINLLPHRQEKRQRRKIAFFVGLGVAAAAGIAVVGVWFLVLQQLTSAQQDRNQFLSAEIKRLETQIKDIATLKAEIEALKARQKAVEDLQTNRNVPVHLLNELVKQTPEGVYLTSIKQNERVVSVTGVAQTNERVSELLRNTAYKSEWLERPELIEIKAGTVQTANREQRRLFDFSMRLTLKQPPAAEKAEPPGTPGAPPAAAAPASPARKS
jgi:type IV pilus assembly protein PilN